MARSEQWAATMQGVPLRDVSASGVVLAHRGELQPRVRTTARCREEREELEDVTLAVGATRASGAGTRAAPEAPDVYRTCFQRDRDRILHSPAFRRLAGKTQVFVFPADHQRTRLTHALEVAQVATAAARATGLNVDLVEAIALGHDCGHGPGGHASEDAFDPFLEEGYNHAIWGADVVLRSLNLCVETCDGIRNHSWSLPSPFTPEGALVSWADRCAYSAHDLEDAERAGIVALSDLPPIVKETVGVHRSSQLAAFIAALTECIVEEGVIGMANGPAAALAALRAFNYEHIYTRPESLRQGETVIAVLRALVEHYTSRPQRLPGGVDAIPDPVRAAVTYVGGMTDRYAFETAVRELGWRRDRLPRGVDDAGSG